MKGSDVIVITAGLARKPGMSRDVYLFDVVDGVPEGKALDMMEGTPHWGTDLNILVLIFKAQPKYHTFNMSTALDVFTPFLSGIGCYYHIVGINFQRNIRG